MDARQLAALLGLTLACQVLAGPVTITPVGEPIPGVGPVGVAVATSRVGTYVVVADHQGNNVRSYGIDSRTGKLTLAGTAAVSDGPSAVAASRAGRYMVVASLRSNDLSVLRLDPNGGLIPVGPPVSSGGSGPVSLDVNDDDMVVVANKDSNQLNVFRLDPNGGLIDLGSRTVGTGPADVKISRNRVVVGHATSNDVHLLALDAAGTLHPIDSKPVGARVSSVAFGEHGRVATVSTFPDGTVHRFAVGPRGLTSMGSSATGGDITDLTIRDRGTVFVAGITPARVAAFDQTPQGLQQTGSLAMSGLSSRNLAIVGGRRTTFVIVNEYNNNQTRVLEVR